MSSISSVIKNPLHISFAPIIRVYNKHSELFSNLTIVSLNSILLLSKIYEQIPRVIPRTALVVFSYTGIISLNAQIKSLFKSSRDFSNAFSLRDAQGMLFTAMKVSVKGLNIILTASMFAAAVIALAGFPTITLAMYAVMRPFGVAGWIGAIANEACDYQQNQKVLGDLEVMRKSPNVDERIHNFAMHSFDLIRPGSLGPIKGKDERKLASRVLRQIGDYDVEAYRENIAKLALGSQRLGKPLTIDQQAAWLHFQNVQGSLEKQVKVATANLGLRVLCYGALGVCKAYPDSIAQWSSMWGISVLYLVKHIYEKTKPRVESGLN